MKTNSMHYGRKIAKLFAKEGLLVFFFASILIFTILSPYFFSIKNFLNVLLSVSVLGITAPGIMMIILSGGIDLSVGAHMALVGCIQTLFLYTYGIPWYYSLLIGLAISCLIGLITGLLVTYGGMLPFIATLGMMNVLRGTAYIISNAQGVYLDNEYIKWLGIHRFGDVPVAGIVMLVIFLIIWILLRKTVFGRYVYAIGGNTVSARLAGINVKKITLILYVICSALAFISGIVMLGLAGSSIPAAGESYALDIVTGVLLGGASLRGGKGSVPRTLLGMLVIGIINNGMALLNVPQYWQIFAKGLVLIFAISLDKLRNYAEANL